MSPESVKYIAIHCSATPPTADIDWRTIDRWHREKGWLRIGYHYVIKRDGTIQPTSRRVTQAGAHVEGFNNVSLGICLIGGVDAKGKAENNFTEDQMQALAKLIITLRQTGYANATVQGHRDFPDVKKDCPSFDVREWLKQNQL